MYISSVVLLKPVIYVFGAPYVWYVEAVQLSSVPETTVIFVNVLGHSLNFHIVCSYIKSKQLPYNL